MPLIHHPLLEREMNVSDATVDIWTSVPRVPWRLGPLPRKRRRRAASDPTATEPSPPGDTDPVPTEED